MISTVARPEPRIGLALGSGSARGWSHIGVIRTLEQAGISPDIVCGTSIGAVVGAAYAGGQIDRLEQWVRTLTWQSVVALLDLTLENYPFWSAFTLGGLHTRPTGEVLDGDGAVIPGLYAAGRNASGMPAHGYNSGLSLADATFSGRLAGAAAARASH